VDAGIEAGDQSINKARTLAISFRTERLPVLAVYSGCQPRRERIFAVHHHGPVAAGQTDRPERPIAWDDLDAAQLNRVIITLSARIQSKRVAAGDTVHEYALEGPSSRPQMQAMRSGCAAVRVLQAPRPAPELVESNNPSDYEEPLI